MGTQREALMFLPDGTALIVCADPNGQPSYRDMQGNPAPQPDADRVNVDSLPAHYPSDSSPDWDKRIHSFTDGRSPGINWYLVTDGQLEGTGYFVGFDQVSKYCVGYLGTAGFRESSLSPEELFPVSGNSWWNGCVFSTQDGRGTGYLAAGRPGLGSDVFVIGRDDKVYQINLRNRSVFVPLEVHGLRSASMTFSMEAPGQVSCRLALRTDAEVLLYEMSDERSRLLNRYPIPDDLRGKGIQFVRTDSNEAVMYWENSDTLATATDYQLYWVTPDGSQRQAAITLQGPSMRPLRTVAAAIVPAPVVLAPGVAIWRSEDLVNLGRANSRLDVLWPAVADFWPALAITQALAAGLALLCYRREVRFRANAAERLLWPLFVLAFGLPGWIGYRYGRSWPMLESCPACSRNVPHDRGFCACCEAEFPPPELKGTEVFA